MEEYISLILGFFGFLYTVFAGIVSFIWNNTQKVKEQLQAEISLNESQKEKIANLEKNIERVEKESKSYIEVSDAKFKQLGESLSDFTTTLNSFITETRIHREVMEKLVSRHEEKIAEYDKSIREFYRKNPDL